MSSLRPGSWLHQAPVEVTDLIKEYKWQLEKGDHDDVWDALETRVMLCICSIARWIRLHGMPSDERLFHMWARYAASFTVTVYAIYADYDVSELEKHLHAAQEWFTEAGARFIVDSDPDRRVWIVKEQLKCRIWTRNGGKFLVVSIDQVDTA